MVTKTQKAFWLFLAFAFCSSVLAYSGGQETSETPVPLYSPEVDGDFAYAVKTIRGAAPPIPEPEFADVDEDLSAISEEGRTMATQSYPGLRIQPFFNGLTSTGASSTFATYMQTQLVPPVISYFQAALKVKYPIASKLSFSKSTKKMCGQTTPSELFTGIAADLAYFFTVDTDEEGSWVASSYACFLASGTKRPLTGTTVINTALFKATTDALLHEKNIYLLLHEMSHSLGFSGSLFKYYLDDKGVKRTGHIKTGSLDGQACTVIDVPPLTTRLRSFFGCPTLEGAYMEGSGSDATAGGHFERRQFVFEAMTSGLIYQQSYSQFTLAMLEGSGWYQPDYSMADPYFFGQGQGCKFLTGTCSSSSFTFDDFCKGSSRGCTNVGRGGGSCSSDTRSNGCRFQYPNVKYDCENENYDDYARLPALESYGRSSGAKCFTGTLASKSSGTSTTSFCFKPTCSGSGLKTVLTLKVGKTTVTCKTEGTVKVSGYYGVINCPDPLTFCSTVGQPICPRGCMGRGKCVNGLCVCNAGSKGKDCGFSA